MSGNRFGVLRLINGAFTYFLRSPTLSASRTITFPAAAPATGQVMRATDTSGNTEWASRVEDYILLTDEKTAGTNGGTFTNGTWRTRTINTEKADTGNHCTRSGNQFTLAAGTYRCRISAPAYYIDRHQTRLRNTSDGTVQLSGSSEASVTNSAGDAPQTASIIVGRFTIASSKTFEVQHQCSTSSLDDSGFGLAANFAEPETYTIAEFWREPG